MVFMTDAVNHVDGKAGLMPSVSASKDGGAFAVITPTVTDRGHGWYSLALTAEHTDTLGELALHVTAAGADPADVLYRVVAVDLADAIRMGLSALPAAAAGGGGGLPILGAAGAVAADVTHVLGQAALTSAAPMTVNVIEVGGRPLGAKVGPNLDTFFGNNGSDTSQVVDDLGTSGESGSTDWNEAERAQIRYRLGLDGDAAEPTARPSLSTFDGGPVHSVREPVVVGSVGDKAGYSLAPNGLDAIAVDDPGAPANQTTMPRMLVALWRRTFKKTTLSSSDGLRTYADDGTTVNSTQAVADDGSVQTMEAAT